MASILAHAILIDHELEKGPYPIRHAACGVIWKASDFQIYCYCALGYAAQGQHATPFAHRPYCGRGGRALALATWRPQEMRSGEASSRSMMHSISVGPSRLASATLMASSSSPPLVARRPRPRPSSALKA